jgi:hypothetical protein
VFVTAASAAACAVTLTISADLGCNRGADTNDRPADANTSPLGRAHTNPLECSGTFDR